MFPLDAAALDVNSARERTREEWEDVGCDPHVQHFCRLVRVDWSVVWLLVGKGGHSKLEGLAG
jgi:hypothetical protein